MTAQVHVLTYGYLADSDLVETKASSHGHTVTRTYDAVIPHITASTTASRAGGRTVLQYDYAYDALGRCTAVANSGEAFSFSNANDLAEFNLYGYNGRFEVTAAARNWGTDTEDTSDAVDGQQAVTDTYSNLYSSATRHAFVAGTPGAFTHDDDGNLTQDSPFDYAWDAENRLTSVTIRDDCRPACQACG